MSGQASNLTPNDFEVTYTATGVDISIIDGDTKTSVYNAAATFPASINLANYGLTFNFSVGANTGDKFLVKPTLNAGLGISVASLRAEDLALASPVQLKSDSNNYSSATISLDKIYSTDVVSSAFNSSGFKAGSPVRIEANSSGVS